MHAMISDSVENSAEPSIMAAATPRILRGLSVDQPYEVPENPELHLMAGSKDADRLASEVIEALVQRKIL